MSPNGAVSSSNGTSNGVCTTLTTQQLIDKLGRNSYVRLWNPTRAPTLRAATTRLSSLERELSEPSEILIVAAGNQDKPKYYGNFYRGGWVLLTYPSHSNI